MEAAAMLTNKYKRIPLDHIEVLRDERQRRNLLIDDKFNKDNSFISSIKERGVMQPIIVEELPTGRYRLVAGERRYAASQQLGLPDIPARMAGDLSPLERQLVELEENIKRTELDWKDRARAVRRIHALYSEINGKDWTQTRTAHAIGIHQSVISDAIQAADAIDAGHPQVMAATSYRSARTIVTRHNERRIGDVLNALLAGDAKPVVTPPESILNLDFFEWVKTYSDAPFSFIHCDFPYGIGIDDSEQAKSATWGPYDDAEDLYWRLCTTLSENLDKLLLTQGHLMFWLPSDIRRQNETLDFFEKAAPSLNWIPIPLVWHKTDNRGILSDAKRRARHVYETALYASRGGRLVVRPVSDAYGAPTSKEIHQSEKPEPMLRHFFGMFVDEFTRMLDPTCGSGTALRAAESLGATHVVGLEVNTEFCESARTFLKKARNLRALERKPDANVGGSKGEPARENKDDRRTAV
jgi:ParB/RepB/Spo0J family partition protein